MRMVQATMGKPVATWDVEDFGRTQATMGNPVAT